MTIELFLALGGILLCLYGIHKARKPIAHVHFGKPEKMPLDAALQKAQDIVYRREIKRRALLSKSAKRQKRDHGRFA